MDIIISEELDSPEEFWFAPDFGENRDKPEKERALLRLRPVTGGELMKIERSALLPKDQMKKHNKDVSGLISARQEAMRKKLFCDQITGMKNWFLVKGKKRIECTDPKELWDALYSSPNAALMSILHEVADAICDASVLEEGLVKN